MEPFDILLPLAFIFLLAKLMGLGAHRIGMPAVIGMLLAGILLGTLSFIPWQPLHEAFFGEEIKKTLAVLSKIGVVLIMFSAGLGTDLKKLKQTGVASIVITTFGVIVPMFLGWLTASLFFGFHNILSNLFYGAILTATSVSVTVAVLKELGKLDSKVGTSIVAAAVIDDVIGIIVLTFVIGFKSPDSHPGMVIVKTIIFFIVAVAGGFVIFKVFLALDKRYPHTRRIPIVSLAFCFALSYVAEKYFGIADITGAYIAGIVLCNLSDNTYIERKVDVSSYMLFGPLFFASIGLKTNFDAMDSTLFIFCICFVIVALLAKIIGCGLAAKVCRYSMSDSLKIGVGMMTRGEVALIVAQKGLAADLLTSDYFMAVILLILFSSIATPIILKFLYNKEDINKK